MLDHDPKVRRHGGARAPAPRRATRAASRSSRITWRRSVRRSWRPRPTSARATCRARSLRSTGGTPASRSRSARAPPARRSDWSPRCRTRLPTPRCSRCLARSPTCCRRCSAASQRLGGSPEKVVCDNDASIVRERHAGRAILHEEVAAFFGALAIGVVVLQPRRPQSKGQVERTNGYLDRSFLPLRTLRRHRRPAGPARHLGRQTAYRRHHRRVGSTVAEAWNVERGFLHALPDPLPSTDRLGEARIDARRLLPGR